MMYGLPAVTLDQELSSGLTPWSEVYPEYEVDLTANAWSVDGADDRSVAFAARLMEQGVKVRILDQSTKFSKTKLSRGKCCCDDS